MFRLQKYLLSLFFWVVLQTILYDVWCIEDFASIQDTFSIESTTEAIKKATTEESKELTEPDSEINLDELLDLDGKYGRYSTQSFEYVNWQHYYEDDQFFYQKNPNHVALIHQRCSVDFVKCISNLEVPAPVCAMFYRVFYKYHRYKVFQSYCHVYLENCMYYHRRYRMINYGGCSFGRNGNEPNHKWEYPPEDIIH